MNKELSTYCHMRSGNSRIMKPTTLHYYSTWPTPSTAPSLSLDHQLKLEELEELSGNSLIDQHIPPGSIAQLKDQTYQP